MSLGTLRSPCASNHSTTASAWCAATRGSVASATAQRVIAVTGVRPPVRTSSMRAAKDRRAGRARSSSTSQFWGSAASGPPTVTARSPSLAESAAPNVATALIARSLWSPAGPWYWVNRDSTPIPSCCHPAENGTWMPKSRGCWGVAGNCPAWRPVDDPLLTAGVVPR